MDTREMKEIEAAVEGILFASGEPVAVDRICVALDMDRPTVELVLQRLQDYYSYERRGIRLLKMEDSYQLCSAPEYGELIRKAFETGKPIITATQMLDSMMKNPRPTRAETSDVANAIYQGTSAIMLSGETAAGAYPVEVVRTMDLIAKTTEDNIDYKEMHATCKARGMHDIANAIAHATVTTAHDLNARAILTVTMTGVTAREISKYRPYCPIVSCTVSEKVRRQMNLSWGVYPLLIDEMSNTEELFEASTNAARCANLVQKDDIVVITAGVPVGQPNTTNLMKVDKIS